MLHWILKIYWFLKILKIKNLFVNVGKSIYFRSWFYCIFVKYEIFVIFYNVMNSKQKVFYLNLYTWNYGFIFFYITIVSFITMFYKRIILYGIFVKMLPKSGWQIDNKIDNHRIIYVFCFSYNKTMSLLSMPKVLES